LIFDLKYIGLQTHLYGLQLGVIKKYSNTNRDLEIQNALRPEIIKSENKRKIKIRRDPISVPPPARKQNKANQNDVHTSL
jgi:hypothetical protein